MKRLYVPMACFVFFLSWDCTHAMQPQDKIYVAGHRGLVGTSLVKELKTRGFTNIVVRTSKELDLRNQAAAERFFAEERPDYVFLLAAKVGGINANISRPAEFIYDNLMIYANVIHAAHWYNVKKLLYLGSSCMYPRQCPQPMREEDLLSGKVEPTNEGYALAKLSGWKLCQAYNRQYGTSFITAIPPNLYGPGDNFDFASSHVMAAFLRRFIEGKKENLPEITIWGTGRARREFLFVEDLVDGLVFLMEHYDEHDPINIGSGADISIAELAALVKKIVGFEGEIVFDTSKPDGMPQKLMNVDALTARGWKAKTSLEEGIVKTVDWYRHQRWDFAS